MPRIMLGSLLAVAATALFLMGEAGTTRPDAEAAIAQSTTGEQMVTAVRTVSWVACGWVSGVYGPVRVCN